MERDDRAVATVFVEGSFAAGSRVLLDDDARQHLRVRRAATGDRIRLLDGRGHAGAGILDLDRREASVVLDAVHDLPALPELRLYLPVADRDRMLWLAEKAVELGVSSWHPILFARSRSVSPRGEGDAFDRKLRARMRSALEQSGGGWLPVVHPVAELDAALAEPARERFVFDVSGNIGMPGPLDAPAAALIGPEGGLEDAELTRLVDAGWRPVRIAAPTLRFETAGIAAATLVRQSLIRAGAP